MRILITALLLSISSPAWADNIAGCEVVLMEKIDQEDNEGVTEIASFRPAADFIASAYDEEIEVLREIDGLPIRAIMCKRKSVVPSESDFPIVATGTPFMISQNFDSTETGLTTVYFKDGAFQYSYNGPDLSEEKDAAIKARLEDFNSRPHDLVEKEKAMWDNKAIKEDADTNEVTTEDDPVVSSETLDPDETSTDELISKDDTPSESSDKDDVPADESMEAISPEEHEALK